MPLRLSRDNVNLGLPTKKLHAIPTCYMRTTSYLPLYNNLNFLNRKYKGRYCEKGRLIQLKVHEDRLV